MTKRVAWYFTLTVCVVALAGVACGDDDPTATPRPAVTSVPAPTATAKPAAPVAGGRVVVGVTESLEGHNPYAQLDSLKLGIWCEVYGCLMFLDYDTSEYVPSLAESWAVENPTTWVFNVREGVKFHDGSPFTAADVVHSFDRVKNDPNSRQSFLVGAVTKAEATDSHTVKLTMSKPQADLLNRVEGRIAITSKAAFEELGTDAYDKKPVGTGPYMLKELVPDQHITITKNPNWWGGPVRGPDEVTYQIIREDEVRVAALLNNDIQIAQFIPPHQADRVANNSNTKIEPFAAIEIMFLVMRPDHEPWDNKLVRLAVAHAIDRQAIIDGLLLGYAQQLHGAVGPGQGGYDPQVSQDIRIAYDPARAKALLTEAGFPNGVDVELTTPVSRYTQDKQITEAVAKMLTDVGIRTTLITPEWPTMNTAVQGGLTPFYYFGRGALQDVGGLNTYFQSGTNTRTGFSHPRSDELFDKANTAFDPSERRKILAELSRVLVEEMGAHFMWRHELLMGMRANIDHKPRLDDRVFANDIIVK